MTDAEELAALRRFHALFADKKGNWSGTVGAKLKAADDGSDIWTVWRAAADATKREAQK